MFMSFLLGNFLWRQHIQVIHFTFQHISRIRTIIISEHFNLLIVNVKLKQIFIIFFLTELFKYIWDSFLELIQLLLLSRLFAVAEERSNMNFIMNINLKSSLKWFLINFQYLRCCRCFTVFTVVLLQIKQGNLIRLEMSHIKYGIHLINTECQQMMFIDIRVIQNLLKIYYGL